MKNKLNKELKEFGIEITGEITKQTAGILTPAALKFIQNLNGIYNPVREELLQKRVERQKKFDAGELPDFLEETKHIRESTWIVAYPPPDMKNRTVEITGPVDRKMVINALNSGANCFMADLEDSCSPTWQNVTEGQVNLRDAVNRTIELKTDKKHYKLNDKIAKLMVRPRGWHLVEKHMLIDGKPISASIFDFGLFMFHNAKNLVEQNETPAFYLPKLESHLEARLWNGIIGFASAVLGLPSNRVRATVLIETLPAVFEMDEILWELREYSGGLNAGRWDYVFSAIKVMGRQHVFPNRSEITMERHMMNSYAQLLVDTCKKRHAQPIGGMAANIPRKDDFLKNEIALAKVRKDKQREAFMGYYGTWVAHPALINLAREQFKNHVDRKLKFLPEIGQSDLLEIPKGSFTYDELCNNISVSLEYMYNWLNGSGCVAINYLMEDLATIEISRSQVWNWLYHGVELDDGEGKVDGGLIDIVLDQAVRVNSEYEQVAEIFAELVKSENCVEFSSHKMYELL